MYQVNVPFQAGKGQQMETPGEISEEGWSAGVPLYLSCFLFPSPSPSVYLEPRWGSQASSTTFQSWAILRVETKWWMERHQKHHGGLKVQNCNCSEPPHPHPHQKQTPEASRETEGIELQLLWTTPPHPWPHGFFKTAMPLLHESLSPQVSRTSSKLQLWENKLGFYTALSIQT